MRGVYAAAGLMLIAAGCAQPLEFASITEIKGSGGSAGTDVYAVRRAAGERLSELTGDQIVDVHTNVIKDEAGTQEEFPGAACKLSARDYSAEFVTPAKVRVPIYRAQSSAIAVNCEKDGFDPKLQQVEVFNETKHQRLNAGSGGGLAGVLVALAVNEMSDESNDDFKYPSVRVVMAQKGATGRKVAASGVPPH